MILALQVLRVTTAPIRRIERQRVILHIDNFINGAEVPPSVSAYQEHSKQSGQKTSMSLYHEAASVLTTARNDQGSIKSLVYSKKGWKSDPKTLFALSTEAAKWSEVLSEVIERSGVLKVEKTVRCIPDCHSFTRADGTYSSLQR